MAGRNLRAVGIPCSLPITSPLAVSSCWPCCGLFSEASGLFSRLQFDLNQGTRVQFALTFFLMLSFKYRCRGRGKYFTATLPIT
jgi:hypothetical protein